MTDPVHGWLQYGYVEIGLDGPELRWTAWRPATAQEAEVAGTHEHRAFWQPLNSGTPYCRTMPRSTSDRLVRVVPAAVVLGIGELRMRRDEEDPSDLSVTIVNANLKVLTPARHYPLTRKMDEHMNSPAHLSGQMRDCAVQYAASYGYKLTGVWACARDFTHRITAVPA
jgi:hypothetical protein